MCRAASARHTASLAGRLANDEPAQRAAVLRIALVAFAATVHDRAALRAASGLTAPPPAATAGRASHTVLCAVLRAGLAAALAGPGGTLLLLGAVLDCCAPLKCGLADVGGVRCSW